MLQIDTPGGLDTSMREIIKAILASRVPVAAFVAPERRARRERRHLHPLREPRRRDGAGHESRRRDAGRRSACPARAARAAEDGEGAGKADKPTSPRRRATMPPRARKQVHDAAAYIRGLAQMRGHNAEWGERAVREAVSLSADEALAQNVIDLRRATCPTCSRSSTAAR